VSPTIAVRSLSTVTAGTSLETHHRFLREAEALRFAFVQSLNKVHEEALDYKTDANKYKDKETAKAARVDASNWQVLSSFSFEPEPSAKRLAQGVPYAAQLVFWLALIFVFLISAMRRMQG
jgi:ABC-2 type transport system permease protein